MGFTFGFKQLNANLIFYTYYFVAQKRSHFPKSTPLAGLGAGFHVEQDAPTQITTVSEAVARDLAGKLKGKDQGTKKDCTETVEKGPRNGKKERVGQSEHLKEASTKEDRKRNDRAKTKTDAGRKSIVDRSEAPNPAVGLPLMPQKHKKSEILASEVGLADRKTKVENTTRPTEEKIDKPPQDSQPILETVQTSIASPLKRQMQPKTLRVLPPTKAENLAESSLSLSSNDSAQAFVGKASSRQGSVVSVNLPGTPLGDINSDQTSVTSTSISRPSSPQQNSKQVQIPARPNTKKRKVKQEKASQPIADNDSSTVDKSKSSVEEPAPVPIIGRKKKSKRSGAVTPTQPSITAMSNFELKAQNKDDANEAGYEPEKIVSQVVSDGVPTEISTQKPPQTAASVISSLQATGNIIVSALEFFKPASGLNYRHELAQVDLPNRDRKIQLSDEDITKLNNHETVRLSGNDERNSSRALISPSGACLRGLSREQEDKFLDLESRVSNDKPPTKYLSNKISTLEHAFPVILPTTETAVPPPTATQLKANDEVLAYNDQFVLQPALQGYPSDRRLQNDTSSILGLKLHKPGEISLASLGGAESNLASTSMMPSSGTAKHASTIGAAPLLTVDEAEAAVSRSRKETEALEKKLNALIKKNRRLAFSSA